MTKMSEQRGKILAKEILGLTRDDGRIYVEDVVAAAAPDESVLHRFFDWDDTEAAEKWRRQQARLLIERVKVTVEDADGATIRVRALVQLESDSAGYRTTASVSEDAALVANLLAQFRRELASLRERHRRFEALLKAPQLFRLIDPRAGGSLVLPGITVSLPGLCNNLMAVECKTVTLCNKSAFLTNDGAAFLLIN